MLAQILGVKAEHAAKHSPVISTAAASTDTPLVSFRTAQKATKATEADLHSATAHGNHMDHRIANLAAEMAKAQESSRQATTRIARLQASLVDNRAVVEEAARRERSTLQSLPSATVEEVADDDEDDSTLAVRITALQESIGKLQSRRDRTSANIGAAASAKRSVERALAAPARDGPLLDRDGDLAIVEAADAAEAADDAAEGQPSTTPRRT
jgi:chromosome segregation ATPase